MSDDLPSVYRLACSTLSERYDPTIFTTLSSSWPEGFIVVESPWGIKAFILGILTSSVHSRVLMLAVSPEIRKKGVGSMLMSRYLEESRKKGAKVVSLEVRKGNVPATEFYHKFGFQPMDVIKNYYNDGEDAYQMQLFI
ncbi:GNAT family N-acetyltransferase [Methanomassiliicoccus luminyensis]|uniref:GNAT family N-acetyltransferase n=1 Tax=Methanomassiliicoccus luminyensis TaxID=1080712 RepID=UPI0011CC2E8D|nr:GNAT family N-acetyltransferase [Methanomassiliicoccus luminyensis]